MSLNVIGDKIAQKQKRTCHGEESNSVDDNSTIHTNTELKICRQTIKDNINNNNNNDDTVLSTIPCEYDGSFLATAQSHSTLTTNTSKSANDTHTQMLWSADHDDLFEQLYDNIINLEK